MWETHAQLPCSWLWHGLPLATATTQGVNQQMEGFFLLSCYLQFQVTLLLFVIERELVKCNHLIKISGNIKEINSDNSLG